MTELRIGDQLVRYDRDATVTAYAELQDGWAEKCKCAGCRNFTVCREQAFPDEFLKILAVLGVDLNKEGEAVHYGPVDGGLHFYGGWFYFVGELIESGERLTTVPLRGMAAVIQPLPGPCDGFQYWLSSRVARPPAVFGKRVVAVEFSTLLPWLIDADPMSDFRPAAKPD